MKLKITVNGQNHDVAPGTTVLQLLDTLNLNRRDMAVEINEQLVPRENHDRRVVEDGDWFEIVTLVGGG